MAKERVSKSDCCRKTRGFRLQLVCAGLKGYRRPWSHCTNMPTPSNFHTPTLNPHVWGAFYIPFHFRPHIHPYVITCIEELSQAASVVSCNRSFRKATVLPRAAMSQHEQPAWLTSWDGRAQKNKPIVELSRAYGVSTHSKQEEKRG